MTQDETKKHVALLRPEDLLAHVEARGWEIVDQGNDALWLLEHPEHDLRQLLVPTSAEHPTYDEAVWDVLRRLAEIERRTAHEILLELSHLRRPLTERDALAAATIAAQLSPCAKSKRGVVVFNRSRGLLGRGWNAPPHPFRCDGSAACRAHCNKLAVHAEMMALHDLLREGTQDKGDLEMLHVKVTDGVAVASGGPSCWQCSREVLATGIKWFWLLHEDGLRRYSAEDFHAITLRNSALPVIR